MFSNLASYIFGSTIQEAEPMVNADTTVSSTEEAHADESMAEKVASGEEEEWVLVGDAPPALNLGSMTDVPPRPALGSTGSSDPSIDSEDSGDSIMQDGETNVPTTTAVNSLTRSGRRLAVPFGSLPAGSASVAEIRTVRAAQSLKVKDSGRHVTAKALERRNKAVKVASASSAVSRKGKNPTVALRAAGASRHLKQC